MRLKKRKCFVLSMPPPSINQSHTIRDRQIRKTSKHQKWHKAAVLDLRLQPRFDFTKDRLFYWSVIYYLPRDKAKYDVGNATKAMTDILVKCNKVPDDRYLVDERVMFVEDGPLRAVVTIEELQKWQKIMKPSRLLLGRLVKYYG